MASPERLRSELAPAKRGARAGRRAGSPPVRTTSLALWPWSELAERIGLGRERARELAGLSQAELRDAAVQVEQSKANRLAALVSEHHGPGAALAAALTVQAGHFQLVEILARSAATVAHGIDVVCRFMPLIHVGGRLQHTRDNGTSVVLWRDPPSEQPHPGYVELLFAIVLEGIRRETGQSVVPSRVWFTHAAPDDLALYRQLFGSDVRFTAPHALFELDAATAALPLLRASASARAQASKAAEDTLQRLE